MYQLGLHVSDPVSFVSMEEFLSYWIFPLPPSHCPAEGNLMLLIEF